MPAFGTLVWVLLAIASGAAVGAVAPERGRRPSTVRWWGLIPLGVGLRVLVEVGDVPGGIVLLLASYALLLAVLCRNWAWRGTPIVALGLGLSALVVSLNGGSPVSAAALEAVGREDLASPSGNLPGERHLELPRDRLVFLGDVLPVPLTRQVTSFGELIALVGLADVAFNVAARRPGRRGPGGTVAQDDPDQDRADDGTEASDLQGDRQSDLRGDLQDSPR